MTKIVRKVNSADRACGFWLDETGAVRHWWDAGPYSPEEVATKGFSAWVTSESLAEDCGTTLAALRDELTERGEADAGDAPCDSRPKTENGAPE